ncbi:uncharacterized protein LOC119404174 [Rhipicephalus sanguineus]|uniref:uncharacterized protein LOC119404174 n=1 Tax=Rhipicephalus sanguineus TaxID=34632 RepID=UPI0018938C25|nr:uncharacterized protein LOC119404174 [Rhipicephalus sanguineus]
MALDIENTKMQLSTPQLMELMKTRHRVGYHIYYQADGTPTTDGYLFSLPSHPTEGYAEVAVVVEVTAGYKTFEFGYDYDEGKNHMHYICRHSAGTSEALATRQYNQKDLPLPTAVAKVNVLPGVHVFRMRIDNDTQDVQLYVDQDALFGKAVPNIEFANQIKVKTEKGRVFEAHYVANNGSDIFDNSAGDDPRQAPRLSPGCYVEVSGQVIPGLPRTYFLISELSKYEQGKNMENTQVKFLVPLPGNTESFVYYVKFFEKHLIVDAGAGIKVYKHNFKAPARYYPMSLWTENVTIVCNNYVHLWNMSKASP